MRLLIAAVGRIKAGPLADLQSEYVKRLGGSIAIKEVEERRALPAEQRKAREGELLLAVLPEDAVVVALDERGKTLASTGFAERMQRWQTDGVKTLAFVIGGADGLAQPVVQRAGLSLSLGAMTWPHLLARILLLEQLYRAQQILNGNPYHRE
ncbi:MAG TPA: 23S rRNA (pseudouridine(1915)-N(3))-methyltransferase RlmH [Stellaceae bacterium]|nr:23S rRNA (pseudouridine(1915)-N(3))-methyltransferase RlmH [Stellaceae bacterium]